MNPKAMFSLSYGLFVLSVNDGKKDNACIINTAVQVASGPDRIAIAVNKANYTNEVLAKTDDFTLSVLSEEASFDVFKRFGFASGRDTDKFAGFNDVKRVENGTLAVTAGTNAYLSAHINERYDLGSHTLFVGTLTDGDVLSSAPSATYAFYHAHIKPQPAQAQAKAGKTVWRCSVCGYEYEGEELPADFVCPLCKHGPEAFEKVTAASAEPVAPAPAAKSAGTKKWRCTVCGEIVESDVRPDKCPLCKADGDKFEEVKEDNLTWAAEHVIGIAKDVPEEIKEGLRANFNGECCEVGMYLAMSRAAAREGYPEIAAYWKTAAFEEAEHAAKFAELLGEVVSPSTAENLAVRVAAENGATAGKYDLAKKAKELNLDAIHDTVHEMARDEARHGKAFAGLLKRYFNK